MAEQPTDWIKDAGWLSGLYETARRGNQQEFDAMLRRLLSEHGRAMTEALADPARDAELRAEGYRAGFLHRDDLVAPFAIEQARAALTEAGGE